MSRGGGLEEAKERVKAAMRDPVAFAVALGLDGQQQRGAFLARCPNHDERTPSCNVSLGDDGTVRVKCFGCGWSGDGFTLVAKVRGLDPKTQFPEVLEAAAQIVGESVEPGQRGRRREFKSPVQPAKEKKLAPPMNPAIAEEYHAALLAKPALLEQVMVSRCLSLETIARAKIGFGKVSVKQGKDASGKDRWVERNALTIPYFRDGQLISMKYKIPNPPDPKTGAKVKDQYERRPGGAEKILYGLDWLTDGAQVVIAEGELDALVLQQAGINAVSIPDGTGSASEKGDELSWLDPVEVYADIVVGFDADKSGKEAAQLLAARLPPRKVRIATWPAEGNAKDPTDFARMTRLDRVVQAIREAKRFEHPLLMSARSALDELFAANSGLNGRRILPLGFPRFDRRIGGGLLYGELVVVLGHTGSGKSTFAGDINFNLTEIEEWCLVASIEMPAREWQGRLVQRRTGIGPRDLTPQQRREVEAWADGLTMNYIRGHGELALEKVLEAMEFARRRYDCRVLIIDHLQKLMTMSMDDDLSWKEIDFICGKLQTAAQQNDVLTILLSHTTPSSGGKRKKKGEDEENPLPTLYSGRGSKGIAQNAALVLGVWRDRKVTGPVGLTRLGVLKKRETTGEEGFWEDLDFDRRTLAYTERARPDDDEPDDVPQPQADFGYDPRLPRGDQDDAPPQGF